MAIELKNVLGELHITDGDTTYQVGRGALTTVVEPGFTPKVVTGDEARRIANKALIEIETKAGSHPKETVMALHDAIDHIGSLGAESGRVTRVKTALDGALQLEHAASAEDIAAILRRHPLSAKFMGENAKENLHALGFDLAEFEKKAANVLAKVEKIAGVNTKLEEMMKAEKPNVASINKLIQENLEHVGELSPSSEAVASLKRATGYDFTKAQTSIVTEVQRLTARAEQLIPEVVKLKDIIDSKPEAAALKEAQEMLGKMEKELGEIGGHQYGAAVKAKLPEAMVKDLGVVHPTMAKELGGAAKAAGEAEKGAKWISGGKWNSFTHTAETVGKDLDKVGKFRYAKAGILAGAAVLLASVVATLGNKGPGPRAEEASRSQGQAAMGVA